MFPGLVQKNQAGTGAIFEKWPGLGSLAFEAIIVGRLHINEAPVRVFSLISGSVPQGTGLPTPGWTDRPVRILFARSRPHAAATAKGPGAGADAA